MGAGLIKRTVEPADVGVSDLDPFALRIVVVHDQAESRTFPADGPFGYLEVAVGIAERHGRTAAYVS